MKYKQVKFYNIMDILAFISISGSFYIIEKSKNIEEKEIEKIRKEYFNYCKIINKIYNITIDEKKELTNKMLRLYTDNLINIQTIN